MSDRKLGYTILFLFFIIFSVIGAYCLRPLLSPPRTRVIAFEKIGNLRIDDQVRLKGITFGTVSKIELAGKKVFVTIQGRNPPALHKGCSVVTLDAGIMGDRMIMIEDGPLSATVIAPGDTLDGIFFPGVSEAVGYMWMLRDVVDSLRDMADLLLRGDRRHPSLVTQTKGIIKTVDSLSKFLLCFASDAKRAVSSGVDSIDAIVKGASRLSLSAAASAPEFISALDKQITDASSLVASINKTTDSLLTASAGLLKQDNILWRDDLLRLTEKLVLVQKAIGDVQRELLQFKSYLRLW